MNMAGFWDRKNDTLGKKIFLWMGSFSIIAIIMVYYGHLPVVPLILAGILTLVVTVLRHWADEKRKG